uniref:Uncharacterized protein n=1 Tax=Onchocerca volvulus TaxID=6282 RepID=A0A8R1TMR1_ONCVO
MERVRRETERMEIMCGSLLQNVIGILHYQIQTKKSSKLIFVLLRHNCNCDNISFVIFWKK